MRKAQPEAAPERDREVVAVAAVQGSSDSAPSAIWWIKDATPSWISRPAPWINSTTPSSIRWSSSSAPIPNTPSRNSAPESPSNYPPPPSPPVIHPHPLPIHRQLSSLHVKSGLVSLHRSFHFTWIHWLIWFSLSGAVRSVPHSNHGIIKLVINPFNSSIRSITNYNELIYRRGGWEGQEPSLAFFPSLSLPPARPQTNPNRIQESLKLPNNPGIARILTNPWQIPGSRGSLLMADPAHPFPPVILVWKSWINSLLFLLNFHWLESGLKSGSKFF